MCINSGSYCVYLLCDVTVKQAGEEQGSDEGMHGFYSGKMSGE
jgi:hypothetical protein